MSLLSLKLISEKKKKKGEKYENWIGGNNGTTTIIPELDTYRLERGLKTDLNKQ